LILGLFVCTSGMDAFTCGNPSLFDEHLLAPVPAVAGPPASASVPAALGELIAAFEAEARTYGPDLDVALCTLSMNDAGAIVVPGHGAFELTPWSTKQLASRVGVRWDRWFSGIDAELRTPEITRRLAREPGVVRLKTTIGGERPPTLRGFVSPSYATIPDTMIARRILSAIGPDARIIRAATTDRSTSYVVQVGECLHLRGPAHVGDVVGGLLVRNSDVGHSCLFISLHLTRLVCKNGMVFSQHEAVLRRTHRRVDFRVFSQRLGTCLLDLPFRIPSAGRLLEQSGHHPVQHVEGALVNIFRKAHVRRRLVPIMLAAYEQEPSPTVFGISQAITLGAQDPSIPPEGRLVLEHAAGNYIQTFAGP